MSITTIPETGVETLYSEVPSFELITIGIQKISLHYYALCLIPRAMRTTADPISFCLIGARISLLVGLGYNRSTSVCPTHITENPPSAGEGD